MGKPFNQLALEELKLLQSIILKHDDLRSTILGWGVGIITGLAVAFISKPVDLDTLNFVFLGTVAVLILLWINVVHKVAQDRAIERSRGVEVMLRDGAPYDGPKISESLSRPNTLSDQWRAANNVRIWAPFAALLGIVIIFAVGHG